MNRLTIFGVGLSSAMSLDVSGAIARADAVCFDVDSTVITEEGIDELAQFCGKGAEVAKLTKEAMKGAMVFQEALRRRLDIIQPSQQQIRDFIQRHPSTLTKGVKNLVAALHRKRTPVFLISGGFHSLISPVAKELNIPPENVYANKLFFYFDGKYGGFDTNQPTCRSGGKAHVIALLKELHGFRHVAMIGDGATDLEAKADTFIGFGGNVVRDEVRAGAPFYITDFGEIAL